MVPSKSKTTQMANHVMSQSLLIQVVKQSVSHSNQLQSKPVELNPAGAISSGFLGFPKELWCSLLKFLETQVRVHT